MTKIKTGTTAIKRNGPSAPMKFLINSLEEVGLLTGGNVGSHTEAVFDMGCGRGDDLDYLKENGFRASAGYDPHHNADKPPWEYGSGVFYLVTCIYVLNVLPTHEERVAVIQECRRLVHEHGAAVFAVRSKKEVGRAKRDTWVEHNDGYITPAGTFQKGFTVGELAGILIDEGFEIVYSLHPCGDYVMVVAVDMFPIEDDLPY